MNFGFRKCEYSDLEYILLLKELCMKWYIEIIYGWDINVQREFTKKELDEHINDTRIITYNNKDIGVTTFYEEDGEYIVGLIIVHPDYQGKAIGTKILKDYINIAKENNKTIRLKTYKLNPAKRLYERLGFIQYMEDDTHVYLRILKNINTPEELLDFMSNNINYGYLGKNGRVYHYDDKDFDSSWYREYILENSNDLFTNLYGNCWDQVEFERDWFLKNGYEVKTIYEMVNLDYDNNYPSHSFLVFKDNDYWYWFENSDFNNRGIHKYNSFEELINDEYNRYINYLKTFNITDLELEKIIVREFDKPKEHISASEYLDFVINSKGVNKMEKVFKKNETLITIALIIIYVVANSYTMQNFGYTSIQSAIINTILSAVILTLIILIKRVKFYGLTKPEKSKQFLYFIPLMIISLFNLRRGIHINNTTSEIIFHIITMLNVGFLEEIIMRGFLFKMMEKDNVKRAIIVSSITFGMGHIVNLLNGADFVPTLLQVCYAIAIGYMLVMVFYKSKSLIPCIIFHGIFNALSVFSTGKSTIISSIILIILSLGYTLYINKKVKS